MMIVDTMSSASGSHVLGRGVCVVCPTSDSHRPGHAGDAHCHGTLLYCWVAFSLRISARRGEDAQRSRKLFLRDREERTL